MYLKINQYISKRIFNMCKGFLHQYKINVSQWKKKSACLRLLVDLKVCSVKVDQLNNTKESINLDV